jgi:hypothetical protein
VELSVRACGGGCFEFLVEEEFSCGPPLAALMGVKMPGVDRPDGGSVSPPPPPLSLKDEEESNSITLLKSSMALSKRPSLSKEMPLL